MIAPQKQIYNGHVLFQTRSQGHGPIVIDPTIPQPQLTNLGIIRQRFRETRHSLGTDLTSRQINPRDAEIVIEKTFQQGFEIGINPPIVEYVVDLPYPIRGRGGEIAVALRAILRSFVTPAAVHLQIHQGRIVFQRPDQIHHALISDLGIAIQTQYPQGLVGDQRRRNGRGALHSNVIPIQIQLFHDFVLIQNVANGRDAGIGDSTFVQIQNFNRHVGEEGVGEFGEFEVADGFSGEVDGGHFPVGGGANEVEDLGRDFVLGGEGYVAGEGVGRVVVGSEVVGRVVVVVVGSAVDVIVVVIAGSFGISGAQSDIDGQKFLVVLVGVVVGGTEGSGRVVGPRSRRRVDGLGGIFHGTLSSMAGDSRSVTRSRLGGGASSSSHGRELVARFSVQIVVVVVIVRVATPAPPGIGPAILPGEHDRLLQLSAIRHAIGFHASKFQFHLQSVRRHGRWIGQGDAVVVVLDGGHEGAATEALAGRGGGEEGFVVGEVGGLGIVIVVGGEVGIDRVVGVDDAASVADVVGIVVVIVAGRGEGVARQVKGIFVFVLQAATTSFPGRRRSWTLLTLRLPSLLAGRTVPHDNHGTPLRTRRDRRTLRMNVRGRRARRLGADHGHHVGDSAGRKERRRYISVYATVGIPLVAGAGVLVDVREGHVVVEVVAGVVGAAVVVAIVAVAIVAWVAVTAAAAAASSMCAAAADAAATARVAAAASSRTVTITTLTAATVSAAASVAASAS